MVNPKHSAHSPMRRNLIGNGHIVEGIDNTNNVIL